MKAVLVSKVNNFVSKNGNVGTLLIVTINGERQTIWQRDPNFVPFSKQLEVEKQLDANGKETQYWNLIDDITVEDQQKMRMKIMSEVFEGVEGLFKL